MKVSAEVFLLSVFGLAVGALLGRATAARLSRNRRRALLTGRDFRDLQAIFDQEVE